MTTVMVWIVLLRHIMFVQEFVKKYIFQNVDFDHISNLTGSTCLTTLALAKVTTKRVPLCKTMRSSVKYKKAKLDKFIIPVLSVSKPEAGPGYDSGQQW